MTCKVSALRFRVSELRLQLYKLYNAGTVGSVVRVLGVWGVGVLGCKGRWGARVLGFTVLGSPRCGLRLRMNV